MKKQALLLVSALLVLSACGNSGSSAESSSSPSPSSSPASSAQSSSTPAEPAKIDVTIKVTASGISEYSGSHSKLYINGNFKTTDWGTYAMTQDSENANVWTYTFTEVEVDVIYRFNIYYGTDEKANWTDGRNKEGDDKDPRTVIISEDQTEYSFGATFEVPSASYTFTLVLTPHIQSTKGTDDAMYDSTYLWMWCSAAEKAALTKQSDGTWTYAVENFEGSKFSYTPCLGTKSDIDWNYKYGQYNDSGTWDPWNGNEITLEEGKTSYSCDVYFNSQPKEVTGDTYSVTWHYKKTSDTNIGGSISVCYKVDGGDLVWKTMEKDSQTNYDYTAIGADIPSGAKVTYHLYSWIAEGDERYLGVDANGTDFSITVSSNLEYILSGDFGASNGVYGVGTATAVE